MGDFNGYYYEDALSTLTNDGQLTNLYTLLPEEERYSYLYEGASQAFDNIVVSDNLVDGASFDVVHVNAEQETQIITDHDQVVATLYIPGTAANSAPEEVTIDNTSVAENAAAGTVIGTLDGHDPDEGDTITFTLASDDERFVIQNNQLVVAAGAVIDYEVERSITLAITATDQAGHATTSSITLNVTDVAEPISGTSGNDTLTGGDGADVIDGGAGDDVIDGGPGNDTITLGTGHDEVHSLLADLLGDTITDFGVDDRIVIAGSDVHRGDFTVSGTSVVFEDGSFTLGAGLSGGDLMVAHSGTDSILTFNEYLTELSDKTAVSESAINGIVNQAYLNGDTSDSFEVSVEAASGAAYHNTIGVYEIDTATGEISDVRIIVADAKNGGTITVDGVEAGHDLGFFLVQDGAKSLSSGQLSSDNLSIVEQNGHYALADNGSVISGATTFFSTSAAANSDGAQHVLSGVASDGSGDIRIGFEDLVRSGSTSDNDFQDVILNVEAVAVAHPIPEALVLHG